MFTNKYYYTLSTNPFIILSPFGNFNKPEVRAMFSKMLKDRRAYFLFFLYSDYEPDCMVGAVKDLYFEYKEENPRHEFVFLCNHQKQYNTFARFNLPRAFCNHNAFVDENIFKILPGQKKRFDSIYNAKMMPFKRHHLAAKINNLALITYGTENKEYLDATKRILPGARWLNYLTGKYQHLTPHQVNEFLNESKVGLCLSSKEGAMYSSMEYLLCGLPIVSTKSAGGRDIFFDNSYVKVAEDTPESVKECVEEATHCEISPEEIRKNTLKLIRPHRERFVRLVQGIYDLEEINTEFRSEWNKKFINKMVEW